MLFDCTSDNISVHLQNIYETDELNKEATTEKISVVRREGNYKYEHRNEKSDTRIV